ncbi:hypothetical protein HNR39_003840 [Glaciimonas immobilis]|uniref:Uncharacterized protein n=1 Tax=Glaciimonas immobilis TaxID=728004 RepID=A0A840RY03_9BURK|nr:hypothetical protein [Glaciimonas immobilis]
MQTCTTFSTGAVRQPGTRNTNVIAGILII